MSDNTSNTQAAIDAGSLLGGIGAKIEADLGIPFALLPIVTQHGAPTVKPVMLEHLLERPTHQRAAVHLRTAQSFIAYVNRFKDGDSAIFANLADRTVAAVLDYHQNVVDGARWGAHRATLTCHLTKDWERWIGSNKKAMTQIEFAQFLEDNVPNIAAPAGGTVIEIARSLEAKKSVDFSSSIRLDNGEHQLVYEESITGTAQKGAVLIPNSFTVGLVPFEGAAVYAIDARFRYRINDHKLSMWYDLMRPESVLEDAFGEVVTKVTADTAVAVYAGAAPDKATFGAPEPK